MSTAVADWPKFLAKLKDRQEIAERTMAFRFEKPATFTFTPGQFIDITLLNPAETDSEGDTRGFSIASASYEDFIMVATRLRDTAFKRVLRGIPSGADVKIEGPFGNLRLHNDKSRAAVVLTGGIGITPFRSILLHAAKEKLPHCIFLFYANRRPEDAPFLDELQELEKKNANRKYVLYAMLDSETSAIVFPPLHFYFGQPSAGFCFCRDFFTESCHLPFNLRTSGLGPGLDFGLSGFGLVFLFTVSLLSPSMPNSLLSCSFRNCTRHGQLASFLVPRVCCRRLSSPCSHRAPRWLLRLLSICGQRAFLCHCPLKCCQPLRISGIRCFA
jgi:NAD(P)H-flavin reductase